MNKNNYKLHIALRLRDKHIKKTKNNKLESHSCKVNLQTLIKSIFIKGNSTPKLESKVYISNQLFEINLKKIPNYILIPLIFNKQKQKKLN